MQKIDQAEGQSPAKSPKEGWRRKLCGESLAGVQEMHDLDPQLQVTSIDSCLDLDEPTLAQQFKKLKLDEDIGQIKCDVEEFVPKSCDAIFKSMSDNVFVRDPTFPVSSVSGANTFTCMDTLLPIPMDPEESMRFKIGMRLKLQNKKGGTKKEADQRPTKPQWRKSLFSRK